MTKTEQWLERAKAVHGDRYDYSETVFINTGIKVKIICRKHGMYEQAPSSHLKGINCQKCMFEVNSGKRRMSTVEYIEKAIAIHGNRYDYSKTNYTRSVEKLIITCKEHGDWNPEASSHLSGSGCPECGLITISRKSRHTQEDFINKGLAVHGDRYSYSKVDYQGSSARVTLVCPEHGDFDIFPGSYLSGVGCAKCGDVRSAAAKLKSTEWWVAEAIKVHGDRYDYSKVDYQGNDVPVIIGCSMHGDFLQSPASHRDKGAHCNKCSSTLIGLNQTHTQEEFLTRAKDVHGERYSYDDADYVNVSEKVKIGCSIHGEFEQTPASHLRGRGCQLCGFITLGLNGRIDGEEYIARFAKVHGTRYDYSKAVYTLAKEPIVIICPKHGEFSQIAEKHLDGNGCSKCNESHGERMISLILDELGIEYVREFTIPNSETRFRYDFYLPKYRVLIEYHGEQHYFPVAIFGGEQGYTKNVIRDRLKVSLARSFEYPLQIFNYKQKAKGDMGFNIRITLYLKQLISQYTRKQALNESKAA